MTIKTKCYGHEECEYNAQPNCALPNGMECTHRVKADKPAAEGWTDIEALIERLNQYSQSLIAYQMGGEFADVCMDAATALSTLQAENKKLRNEVEGMRSNWYKSVEEIQKLRAELARVKAERDAAVEAVKNMAEYIVCAGRVDYFLCDEISQEHHLKYQPKNDGNYDNEPCYKCVADWFLQGHKWQESE